jgi:CRP/FNR family transcriptional regulator, cyclic AMP receptor protein
MEGEGAPESIGENKIWYLKKNRLFANVPIDAVVDGAGIFTMETLPKRATFFDQGDATKVVYLIKTGRVRIARNTADGKEVTVAILGPGDMFGEDALFGGIERTTVATCMEETLICRAHADDLFGLLAGNSALALNVAQMLSDRLGDASATIEDLAYAKISDRLVNLFDRLAGELGRPTGEGTFLDVRLTHQDIASIIGSTRETVSLEMNQLVRAGAIKQEGGYITVLTRKE